ncbi:MAG TPA: hypothetical protein VFA59_16465 [Vicinamibacterales bacterium]|nr:hypothetical protein [Vicinamibacterales bacterium]
MTRVFLALAGLALVVPSAHAASPTPTFTKDIAPILYNRCVTCHRAGEVAPMALMTYDDVRPWAKAIKRKVENREMPPWGADPHFGKFKDDQSLTAEQIVTIATWVDAGAPKGNDADLPPAPKFAAGWSHGAPDYVIDMPIDFEIPAEGEVPVTDFFSKTPFDHDVYVKALEVRPGTNAVVHHAGLYVIDRLPPGAKLVDGRIVDANGKAMSRNQVARANGGTTTEEIQKLLSFVPGRGYESYQGDAGQLIKAGSYIDFYMHYTPTGTPQKDRTRLGLYVAKAGQDVGHQIYHSFSAAGPTTYIVEGQPYAPQRQKRDDPNAVEGGVNLPNIPPYAENWKVVSIHTIKEPITLYGLTPHLHLRGKSMKYVLTLPDGQEETLLDVPKYDFNWQLYYELESPRHIPAGSKVTVTTLFDNSGKNPYNPAPEKEVFWSEQSWDEMYAPQARITVDARDLRKPTTTTTQQQQK